MDDLNQRIAYEASHIEGVRKRPRMYVGSTDLFGLIHYLVCPVALLLGLRPTRIAVAARAEGFIVEADVAVPIEEQPSGRLAPFEEIVKRGHGHSYEGTVVNALSERLTVEVQLGQESQSFTYRRGVRESYHEMIGVSCEPRTTLGFIPDASIFTVTDLSPTIFESYLRRLSFLYQGVRFSLALGPETHNYHTERGVVDLFTSVSAPYQILHEPIYIVGDDGALHLEAALAYHSWKANDLWCFINNGRAVEGGTHELGLIDALDQLYRKFVLPSKRKADRKMVEDARSRGLGTTFKMPTRRKADRNGVIGIMSLQYPETVWEGCIKSKIGNPELRGMVCNLIVERTSEWLKCHPDVAAQLQHLQIFSFPDAWYK